MIPIRFNKVSHTYGERQVLKNLTFDIEENLITVIIGKSGSGKSTLLQMINALVIPGSGEVLINEKPIDYNNVHSLRRNIGYAVQGTGLFPHMTVAENIALPGVISGKPLEYINSRTDELLELVDLNPDYKTKYPYKLSGGEQQRVGICRAMLLNPPIFLLDEAFGALDPITRFEIHKEVLKLQQLEPRTIVMVTHDLREAEKLADKIMIIEEGVIQQYDNKEKVIAEPANDFVKEFLKIQK